MKKSGVTAATSSKVRFDDSDDQDSSSDNEEAEIEEELAAAEVTFEELQRAKSDGSDMVYRKPNVEKKSGRANKNRPMEVSSKKPVSRFREVIQAPKKVVRDPRFESLCGELDVEGFKKRYDFIYENTLPAEKEELKKQMKKAKDPEAINELKDRIARIDKELRSAAPKRSEKDILAEHKKKEREAAKKGKKPYYLKKCNFNSSMVFCHPLIHTHMHISRKRKFGSKSLLRNTRNSRSLEKLRLLLKRRGGRMLQRTTDTCPTAAILSKEASSICDCFCSLSAAIPPAGFVYAKMHSICLGKQ